MLFFQKAVHVKDYENIKLVNLSSGKAAQLPLILCMISENSDFGEGGHVKCFYKSEFNTHDHKIHQFELENYLLTICIQIKLERFSRYGQICVERLPLLQIRKNKPKIKIPPSC